MAAFASQPFGTRRAIARGSSFGQSIRKSPAYAALESPAQATGSQVQAATTTAPAGGTQDFDEFLRTHPNVGGGIFEPARKRIAEEDRLGVAGALNPPPQIQAFYRTLLGNRLRAIESLAGAQRYAGLNSLESRGMGQSSEVGRLNADIASREQLAGQEAASGVQALQYAQFQSAMDFERQKYLTRLAADVAQDRSPWWGKAIPGLGSLAGEAMALLGGGSGGGAWTDPNEGKYL